MDERAYLKVKIKSLAEEARIIRKETKRAKSKSIKEGLALHRKGIVRHEARHTHLAYGFLRGREYRQMEHKAHEAPDWAKVRRMVEKYGSHLEPWSYNSESYSDYEKRCQEHKIRKAETLKRFDEWVAKATTIEEAA